MTLSDLSPGDEVIGPSGTRYRVLRVEAHRAILRTPFPTVSPYVGLLRHRH